MESSKVKLPREVAEAIERQRRKEGLTKFGMTQLWNAISARYSTQDIIILHKHFTNADEWLEVVVNGYEVEQTPEDKVRELYDEYKTNEQKARVRNDTDAEERLQLAAFAIRETLDALNIKIKGVNDHE